MIMDWTVERGIILRLQCILMMFVLLLHVEEKTITSFCRQLVASGFVIYIYLLLIHLYIFVAKIIVIDSLNLTLASSNVPQPYLLSRGQACGVCSRTGAAGWVQLSLVWGEEERMTMPVSFRRTEQTCWTMLATTMVFAAFRFNRKVLIRFVKS